MVLISLQTNKEISITTDQNLLDGEWHHVLLTQGAGEVSFYLDGQLKGRKYASSL